MIHNTTGGIGMLKISGFDPNDITPAGLEALFNYLREPYRRIKLSACGFSDMNQHELLFTPRSNKIFFPGNPHCIDISKNNFHFVFNYYPRSIKGVEEQMVQMASRRIMRGLFERKFFVDPDLDSTDGNRFVDEWLGGLKSIPVKFSYVGEKIPGLMFRPMVAVHWSFFIPLHTREGKLMEAALTVYSRQFAHKAGKNSVLWGPGEEALYEKLKAFATLSF